MNAPTPALVARPERLRLVGQRRQILAVMHQRLMFGMLVYVGVVALIALRILYLAAFGDHAGRKLGVTTLIPERGDIVDRDGHALARTIDAWTIALHPTKMIGNKLELARTLAQLMPERDEADLLCDDASDRPFFYLRRRAAPDVVAGDQRAGRAGACDRSRTRPALSADHACGACARLHRCRRAWHRRDRARVRRAIVRSGDARRADHAVDLQPGAAGARA